MGNQLWMMIKPYFQKKRVVWKPMKKNGGQGLPGYIFVLKILQGGLTTVNRLGLTPPRSLTASLPLKAMVLGLPSLSFGNFLGGELWNFRGGYGRLWTLGDLFSKVSGMGHEEGEDHHHWAWRSPIAAQDVSWLCRFWTAWRGRKWWLWKSL